MKNILTIKQAIKISNELKKEDKKIILSGGCFDILHPGHFSFLENAKKEADILFVFIENDKKITETKGKNRPIHTQLERAKMIASLRFTDYVIILPYLKTNEEYDEIIAQIKPDFIAATENDPGINHKKRQAEKIHAKLRIVTKYIEHKSSSLALKILETEI